MMFGFFVPAACCSKLAATDPGSPVRRANLWTRGEHFHLGRRRRSRCGRGGFAAGLCGADGRSTRWFTWRNRLAVLGYALPGAVIAVGILLPLGKLDNAVAVWLQEQFGINTGLLLTGSVTALIYAYLVRFLAVAFHTVEAGLTRVTPSMDDAARSLGILPVARSRGCTCRSCAGSLATAALLVFVDVLKELPATFAMRPFNFDTLRSRPTICQGRAHRRGRLPSLVWWHRPPAADSAFTPDRPLQQDEPS